MDWFFRENLEETSRNIKISPSRKKLSFKPIHWKKSPLIANMDFYAVINFMALHLASRDGAQPEPANDMQWLQSSKSRKILGYRLDLLVVQHLPSFPQYGDAHHSLVYRRILCISLYFIFSSTGRSFLCHDFHGCSVNKTKETFSVILTDQPMIPISSYKVVPPPVMWTLVYNPNN